jgi:hypothetical protein
MVLRERDKTHVAFRPADRRRQRGRQDVEKVMPLCIALPRIGHSSQDVDRQRHRTLFRPNGRIQIRPK